MVRRVNADAADQAADQAAPSGLESLAAEAESTLNPPPLGEGVTDLDVDAQANGPAVPPMTNAQCILMAVQLVRGTLDTVAHLKTPAVTLSDAKIEPAAAALGAVFDKHGWNLQQWAGDYAAEIAAVATAGPVAWAAWQGIKGELAEAKKAKPAAAPADPDNPDQAVTVAAGNVAVFPKGDPRNVSLDRG
ncbi:MAG: hypothetical protein NDJ19_00620 [Ramlibacter sp.]|nr:hypothetical protein [Ramlibacter sp.]